MKHNLPSDTQPKFQGNVRHYHLTNPGARSTWDAWVDGDSVKVRSSWNWLKILGILVGLLVLGGTIAGLLIVLG